MALRNQVEAIVNSMTGMPIFIYGTADELNTLADDPNFASNAAVFMYAIQQIDLSYSYNGAIDDDYNVYFEFLKKTEFGLFTAENEVEVNYCLKMAKEFMIKIREYKEGGNKFFRIKTGGKAKAISIYDKYDVNMVGVSLSLSIETMYNDKFC